MWHVKTEDDESYGPVERTELDAWVAEGRLNRDCQLLREGDEQWQWADAVYPELAEEDIATTDEDEADEGLAPATSPPPEAKKSVAKIPSRATVEKSTAKSGSAKATNKLARPSASTSKRAERESDEDWSDDAQLSDRSRITAGLLGIFLGPLGLHRIYLGYVLIGLLMLASGGGCGIWSLIDAIRVLLGKVPDSSGKTLRV